MRRTGVLLLILIIINLIIIRLKSALWKVYSTISKFDKLMVLWGFSAQIARPFFHILVNKRPDPTDQKLTPKNDGFCLCRTTKMRFSKIVIKIDGFLLWKGRKNSQFLCRVVERPYSFSFMRLPSPFVQFHEHSYLPPHVFLSDMLPEC